MKISSVVPGSRLFCSVSGQDEEDLASSHLRIYDFGHAGRAMNLHARNSMCGGGGKRWISPSLNRCKLPWLPGKLDGATLTARHNGIIFCVVGVPYILPASSPAPLNDFPFVAPSRTMADILIALSGRCTL